ncbi:MAG: hypothetical protein IKX97_04630 [Erysipelotrichaceae bacterium]|nr:hypothetical protein [Erysipelotrichaceae bacterium]
MVPVLSGLKIRNDVLESCYVSTGGGMLGGHRSLKLKKDADGNAILELKTQETHADREITTVYQVDTGAFDVIAKMVNEYDLYAASKRRYSDMQVLDGDTTSIYFDYSKESFSVSEEKDMNRKMTEGFWKVRDYLESLINGNGVTTVEAQTALLYLKSGYTLQFIVKDEFDGKFDGILSEENEVSGFLDKGIILNAAEGIDVSLAEPVKTAPAGSMVYDSEGRIIILYEDHEFDDPVYIVAQLDGYVSSACPLIAEMEGPYRLYLN